jgi:hypothetical protein
MSRLQSLLPILLIVVVAVTPIPLASNRDWAWSPVAATIGAALLVQSLSLFSASARDLQQPSSLLLPGLCLAIVLVWAVLQILPLDLAPNPLFGYTADALGAPPARRIAIDAERAISSAMRLIAYAGVFYLAAVTCRDSRTARHVATAVIVSAVVVTMYGMAMQVDNNSCVTVTIVKLPIGSSCSFSGTFRNSSSYATFAGMACIVCVADLHARFLRIDTSTTNFRQRARDALAIMSGKGGLIGGALIILTGGLLLSGSKAGAAGFLLGCIVMMILTNIAQRRRSSTTLLSLAIVAVFGIAMAVVGGEVVANRLLAFAAGGDPDRAALHHIALQAIALHPWVGWGLGGFESAFSLLQPADLELHYERAHDSYLESAVELGIPAACLLVLAVALPVARCIRGVFTRSRDFQYCAMVVGIAVLIAFQTFFDFSIQIPAVAIVFSALLGAGWAQSRSSRDP